VESGLPVPRRRTFATGILPFAHSEETFASQSLLRSVSYAGSRGTGNPDLAVRFQSAQCYSLWKCSESPCSS